MSVRTARELVRFCQATNATLELDGGDAAFDWITTVQCFGGFFTTFSEASRHCDLAIMIGDDRLLECHPRLLEELWSHSHVPSQIVLLGEFTEAAAERVAGHIANLSQGQPAAVTRIALKPHVLYRQLRRLAARDEEIAGDESPIDEANQLLEKLLSQAQSRVVILNPFACDSLSGQLYAALAEFVLRRAEERSTAVLPMGGGATTLQQAVTWLTGWPGRIHFTSGGTEYDPRLHRAADRDGKSVGGLEIYVAELNCIIPVPSPVGIAAGPTAMPRVFIGCRPEIHRPTDTMLPAARLGIETGGAMFRGDAAVALRCEAVAPANFPTAEQVLRWLREGLTAR